MRTKLASILIAQKYSHLSIVWEQSQMYKELSAAERDLNSISLTERLKFIISEFNFRSTHSHIASI